MEIQFEIEWEGVDITVTGDYFPGCRGSRWEPPEDPEFEITALSVDGVSAMWLRNTTFWPDIVAQAEDEVEDVLARRREQDAEDMAEARAMDRELEWV